MANRFNKIKVLIRDLIKEEEIKRDSEERLRDLIKRVLNEVKDQNQVVDYIDICGIRMAINVDSSEAYNEFYTTYFESKPNKLIFDKAKNLYVPNWVAYGLPANPSESQLSQIRAKYKCKPKFELSPRNPLKGTPEPMKGTTVDNTYQKLDGRTYAVGNEETIAWLEANRLISPEELRKQQLFTMGIIAFILPFTPVIIPYLAGGAVSAATMSALYAGTGYIAAGIYATIAIEKAKDGDYHGAALDAFWSILGFRYPKGLFGEALKYFHKLGPSGVKTLRSKLEDNKPLTNLEYLAIKELNDNPEVIGKMVEDALKKDKIPMGNFNPVDAAKKSFKK
jgi:hypothetical protein